MARKARAAHPLGAAALGKALASLPAWRLERRGRRSELVRTYEFPGGREGFLAAIAFMAAAATEIDRMNHHPTWANQWVRVAVGLSTHDAGDRVTAKDVRLARVLERLFRKRVGDAGGA
jgi:4a-hydroxytetrahydrobiopterin dehydratase